MLFHFLDFQGFHEEAVGLVVWDRDRKWAGVFNMNELPDSFLRGSLCQRRVD